LQAGVSNRRPLWNFWLVCRQKSNIAISGGAELSSWLGRSPATSLRLWKSHVRAQMHGCCGIGGILERVAEVAGAVLKGRRIALLTLP
jgi:hypothetical protein